MRTCLLKPIDRDVRNVAVGLRFLTLLILGVALASRGSAAGATEKYQEAYTSVLTNALQVRNLTVDEAKELLPVRMTGVITYVDSSQDWLFVQDESGGVFVMSSGKRSTMTAGQEVELTGISHPGSYSPFIFGGQFKVLGSGNEPKPLESTVAGLWGGKADGCRVEVSGTVGSAIMENGRLTLQVVDGKDWLRVVLQTVPTDWQDWANARVRVRGVCAVSTDKQRHLTGVQVFVPEGRRPAVEVPAPKDPFALPMRSIAEAITAGPGRELEGLIRIRGVVQAHGEGAPVLLRDESGSIGLKLTQTNELTPGVLLDVLGSIIADDGEAGLRMAEFRRIGIVGTNEADLNEWMASAPDRVGTNGLTSIQQVRALDSEQAKRALRVRVRGVVTYYDPNWGTLFVQGSDAGIYVDASGGTLDLKVGDRIELAGSTAPGDYAAIITRPRFQKLGRAPHPIDHRYSLKELSSGAQDSQWIGLQGVVRSAKQEWGHITLEVADAGGVFEVVIPVPEDQPAPLRWVDARVRLKGVCGTIFNQRRQLIGLRLFVPALEFVEMDQSPPEDPFALPLRAVGSLLQFAAGDEPDHRVRVRGTVTLNWPEQFIYLQDDSGGVMIKGSIPKGIESGDLVEVAGFPSTGNYTPILVQSIVRKLGAGDQPRASDVTAEQALGVNFSGGIFDAKLVTIRARLLDLTTQTKEQMLVLQAGSTIFNAYLDSGQTNSLSPVLRVGSELQLTGVCSVQVDSSRQPNAFQLYLRSPTDIRILKAAPWWTFRHTAWVLGGLGAVLFMVIGWVVLLRSQVRRQTSQLHQEVEEHKRAKASLEAEMAERKRMELEIERSHRELLVASRQAGMAEVATGVLHNVGNVLNSVNVSATLIGDRLRNSKTAGFTKVAALLKERSGDLPGFFANDARAAQLPDYLEQFAGYLTGEREAVLGEVESLQKNVGHIKDIVAMQQNYAKHSGITESIKPVDLIEDALQLNSGALDRHAVEVVREFEDLPPINMDKHKVLQILVNFVRNAKYACDDSGRTDKRLTVGLQRRGDRMLISVADNGIGIPPENLNRIFNHGFTTRKDGHGFGLHSSANAAREMGGVVTVHSDGPGMGAVFTLELPVAEGVVVVPQNTSSILDRETASLCVT